MSHPRFTHSTLKISHDTIFSNTKGLGVRWAQGFADHPHVQGTSQQNISGGCECLSVW